MIDREDVTDWECLGHMKTNDVGLYMPSWEYGLCVLDKGVPIVILEYWYDKSFCFKDMTLKQYRE